MKSAISTDKAPAAIGPYSQGVKAGGNMVFVSGQLPKNPATGEMAQGIENQARQCLANIKSILEAAGLSMDNVVKTVIFMTDLADFQRVNEVYATFFNDTPPARSTVQVAALPVGVPIEIEAIAMD